MTRRDALSLFAGLAEDSPRFRAKSLRGESFDSGNTQGKVVLVQQWTTWCPYCRQDQAAVDDALANFASQGLLVLAVNRGESRKKVEKYLSEYPRQGHIVLLADTNLGALFPGKGLPHYALLGRNGKLLKQQSGAGGPEALYALLELAGLKL